MASGINRWNMHSYSAYERMAYTRSRRAEAAQMVARSSALANSFATIQSNNMVEQGNLISRVAMSRISKKV
jgi:hypothetical protein